MANEITVRVKAEDQATPVIKNVEKSATGLGKVLGDVGKIAGGFLAANVVAGGVQQLTSFMGDSITAAKESKAVNAQLDAVLQSTGGAAGLAAGEIREMAAALEKQSLFEDEAILNGQNLLLTFTNIGRDVFPQATQTILDMSQALGQDMKSSAVQLGKALNDPITGITALSRVGVSFTEEQKAQIEAMQEAGDVAGAQAIILAELNKEFGGSAKAASDAAGAQEVYKDKMNDLKEQVGEKMLPIQEKWLELQAAVATVIAEQVIPAIENFVKYIQIVLSDGDTLNDYLANLPEPLQGVAKAFGEVVLFIKEHWPQINAVIQFVADYVKAQIEGMIQMIEGIAKVVTGVIDLVSALAHGEWAQAWDAMKQIAEGTIDIFIGNIKRMFGSIPEMILGLATQLFNAGMNFADQIIQGIKRGLENFTIGIKLDSGIPGVPSIDTKVRPFSFLKEGLDYVPYDNFPAMLHKGERVVPASENVRGGGSGGVVVNLTVNGSVLSDRDLIQKLRDALSGGALPELSLG